MDYFTSKKCHVSNYISKFFQLQFLVENNKLSWKILFAIENHGRQKVQVASNIPIENINHMSTPH
jgi:hypothetical protein